MNRISYAIEKESSKCCYGCQIRFFEGERVAFGFPEITGKTNKKICTIHSCCEQCFYMDIAVREAAEERRRFTKVGVYPSWWRTRELYANHDCTGDERCLCGAVTLMNYENNSNNSFCVKCSILHSRLGKMDAERKIITKMLRELKREIKNKTQQIGV